MVYDGAARMQGRSEIIKRPSRDDAQQYRGNQYNSWTAGRPIER